MSILLNDIRRYIKMVRIQLELNDLENEIVSIFKIKNKLLTKQEAIKEIIKKFNKDGN